MLADLQRSLRGSQLRIGKRRRVQESYSFWVDIYVEIARDLCAGNGEGDICDSGTMVLLLLVHRNF